jgi:putative acetyltransferase
LIIRKSSNTDINALLSVQRLAFGDDEGPEIIDLVTNLLADPSAKPLLSLIAVDEEAVLGHVLFTRAQVTPTNNVSAAILAPLAVVPPSQRQGIGGELIKAGLKILSGHGVELVFVLGHPEYYPRYGFRPAGKLGFEAPYPIAPAVAEAWMVQELSLGLIGSVKGKVVCAKTLDRPEYWSE